MNPARSLLLATAGAVGSAAALVASPRAYGWLRARIGAGEAGGTPPLEDVLPPRHTATGVSDARDALRARLSGEPAAGPPGADVPASDAVVADGRRAAVEETRSRARERAARGFGDPRD